MNTTTTPLSRKQSNVIKFITLNFIGIFVFFVTIPMPFPDGSGGYALKESIFVDHVVSYIRLIPNFDLSYASLVILVGAILPFSRKTWNKDGVTIVFSIFKLLGIAVLAIHIFGLGPERIHDADMLPFVVNKVVVPVTALVPIGAVFLAFLINYGLMECIGVFMKPIMRPLWRTPGRSAIDAVASFVASYSVGLLITNRVYKEGYYSTREASIIATGFSTVSATFMVIVAKTLGLMEQWNLYFWTTLMVTFLVTAITTHIYPLAKKSDKGYRDCEVIPEAQVEKGKLFSTAIEDGLVACSKSPKIMDGVVHNFRDGLNLALNIGATLISIGFFGLVLAEYTPIFDVIGYLFYPVTALLGFGDEAMLLAKAGAISLAEMFLPASIVAGASPEVQAVTAIMCVSEILFFSASIPCILSTDIDLNLKDILIIWCERVILSLIFATFAVRILF